jgi:nucleoside-diphosphate-sugar epimerase
MTPVLVTGAHGFVGSALARHLEASGRPVRRAVREGEGSPDEVAVGDIGATTDWRKALAGIDVVVHAAARVHQTDPRLARDVGAFRRVNRDGTVRLARQALDAGVRRFVFLSSIKVNGDRTEPGRPFRAGDAPAPADAYGTSKLEAEQALADLARQGLEIVVIRPPLVYGPGVKANFRAMLRWIASGRPLPLGSIHHNRRSLIALDNLVDFVATCLDHPHAVGRELLPSDGEDVSTAELLQRAGRALHRPARLVNVPIPLLRLLARGVGRPGWADRLCDSLQVDSSDARTRLGWSAPVPLDDALAETAHALVAKAGASVGRR